MYFFKVLYYNLYNWSKRNNSTPEIPVLGFISFCQTNNILTLISLILILFNLNIDFKIHTYFIGIQILTYLLNLYFFEIRKKGRLIIQNNSYSLGNYFFLIYMYIILSVFFTGLSFYYYKMF